MGGKLQAIFQESRKTYGLPRLQASLRQQGIRCGKKRIARLQDRHGLHPVQKRRDLLTRHRTAASMSRKGNCYDNAAMESFWATPKTECFGRSIPPETKEQARLMIFDYIEAFYNRTRLHSALGYKSPLDFESPQSHKPEKP